MLIHKLNKICHGFPKASSWRGGALLFPLGEHLVYEVGRKQLATIGEFESTIVLYTLVPLSPVKPKNPKLSTKTNTKV